MLHVNSASELRTEVIDLGRILPTDVVSKLSRLGIADPRYPIRTTPGSGLISVSGPPPYIVLVRQTLIAMARADTSGRGYQGAGIPRLELADNAAFRCFDNSRTKAPGPYVGGLGVRK